MEIDVSTEYSQDKGIVYKHLNNESQEWRQIQEPSDPLNIYSTVISNCILYRMIILPEARVFNGPLSSPHLGEKNKVKQINFKEIHFRLVGRDLTQSFIIWAES